VDYYKYETVDGLLENMPNANVTESLANAVEGDYVVSDNGAGKKGDKWINAQFA
jgi:hypothetical protein